MTRSIEIKRGLTEIFEGENHGIAACRPLPLYSIERAGIRPVESFHARKLATVMWIIRPGRRLSFSAQINLLRPQGGASITTPLIDDIANNGIQASTEVYI
jgi:hypothetical protein